jgi:hypothetical protein
MFSPRVRGLYTARNSEYEHVRIEWTGLSRVEAWSNISTEFLRVVGGHEKGTQRLGVQLGHPVPGEYKYGDVALQDGGVSNLRR